MEEMTKEEIDRAMYLAPKYIQMVYQDLDAGVDYREVLLALWAAAGAIWTPNHMRPRWFGK